MAIIHDYPYTDLHEMNLDWIVSEIKKLNTEWDDFKIVNTINFGGNWDITKQYKPWTIVDDNGFGYISIKAVPVGIPLTNTEYWTLVVNYSSLIAQFQNRIVALEGNRIKRYETAAQMQADTDLNSGMVAETLGFYTKNDGGGATYVIGSTGTPNSMDILQCDGTLVAVLVPDSVLNIRQLGAKSSDATFNNAPVILRALALAADVYVPTGDFYSECISLQGLKCKKIYGDGVPNFYGNTSKILFTNAGYGFKCCEDAENPSWNADNIIIEGLQLTGQNLATVGINGHYDITVRNCWIRQFTSDGIRLEGFTFPALIDTVTVQQCGGAGLHVKSPSTTNYKVVNCEFSNNNIGMKIEGGDCCIFDNVKCQGNTSYGIEVYKPSSGYSYPIYCDKLTFINCYTEANGDKCFYSHAEGGSNDKTFAGKIVKLGIIDCSFNYPSASEKGEINHAYDIFVVNTEITNNCYWNSNIPIRRALSYSGSSLPIDYTKNSFFNVQPLSSSEHCLYYSNGFIGLTGQYKAEFKGVLTDTSLSSGPRITGMSSGIYMNKDQMILGVNVRTNANITAGTLSLIIKDGFAEYDLNATNTLYTVTLTAGQVCKRIREIFVHPTYTNSLVTVVVQKSADFASTGGNGICFEMNITD